MIFLFLSISTSSCSSKNAVYRAPGNVWAKIKRSPFTLSHYLCTQKVLSVCKKRGRIVGCTGHQCSQTTRKKCSARLFSEVKFRRVDLKIKPRNGQMGIDDNCFWLQKNIPPQKKMVCHKCFLPKGR